LKKKLIIEQKEITLHSAVNGRGEVVLKCQKYYKFTRNRVCFVCPPVMPTLRCHQPFTHTCMLL